MAPVVVSATVPSTMGKKLVNASLNGKDDDVGQLLNTATAEEVNWQDEVKLSFFDDLLVPHYQQFIRHFLKYSHIIWLFLYRMDIRLFSGHPGWGTPKQ